MNALQTFSTNSIPVHQRLDYWNQLVDQVYAGTFVDAPAEDFCGNMAAWSVGELDMIRPASTESRVGRRPRPIDDQRLILHLQCRGTSRHTQGRRVCETAPGDFVLSSAHEPYSIELARHEMLVVEFPRAVLEERMPGHVDLLARSIPGSLPATRMLYDFLLSLWRQGQDGASGEEWATCANHVFYDMLLLALKAAQNGGDCHLSDSALRARLIRFIEANIRDPELKTAVLAEAMGTSTRTVQTCFSEMGTTPTGFILQKRLERAADHMMAYPDAPITQVAFEYGFNDSAYFSRCFRQQFGESPRDWRRGQ